MEPKKSNKMFVIITCISIVAIVGVLILIGVLYINTNIFKSDQEMFQTYFLQNFSILNNIIDIDKETEYIGLLEENDFIETTATELVYKDSENNQETFTGNITGTNNISENKKYKDIEITSSSTDIMEIEYLNESDIYGLNFVNVAGKYATIDFSSDTETLLKYFGLDESLSVNNINDINLSEVFTLTDDEKTQLETKYLSVILGQISKSDYFSGADQEITLSDGQTVTASVYLLTLSQEQVKNIYTKILETLYEDETILAKIENVDTKINEMGITLDTNLKTRYLNLINEKLNSINISNSMTIAVYEANEVTVRTSIEYGNNLVQIDLNNFETNDVTIKYSKSNAQDTTISIVKSDESNLQIDYEDYNGIKVGITRKLNIDENDVDSYTKFTYSGNGDISELDITIDRNITIGTNSEIPTSFDSVGKIVLNDYDDEKLEEAISQLRERIVNALREKRDEINSEVLDYIVQYNNTLEENKKEAEETAKNLFNSKFELYEGEELEEGIVLNLLDELAKNMSNYQSSGENKFVIFVTEGKENKELAEEIETKLVSEDTTTKNSSDYVYNVSMVYDDTGLISQVIIEKYEPEKD